MVARRDWTRRWFASAVAGPDDLVTSLATIAELQAGEFPGKQDALELFADLPLLDLTDDIDAIVNAYIARQLMPKDPGGDALHLAGQ